MGRFTRRFTEEQEREILSLYFTNPFADVAFIKPMPGFGPEEQASLAAKFSRDPEPYQKKFLKLIEKGNDVDMGLIAKLAEDPKSASLGLTGSLSKDAARFHTQWSLGCNSLLKRKIPP
jgi:hypothetical protein